MVNGLPGRFGFVLVKVIVRAVNYNVMAKGYYNQHHAECLDCPDMTQYGCCLLDFCDHQETSHLAHACLVELLRKYRFYPSQIKCMISYLVRDISDRCEELIVNFFHHIDHINSLLGLVFKAIYEEVPNY